MNYSMQISLVELKAKLERLNGLNANDQQQAEEVINILSDIAGQVRGSRVLSKMCSEIIVKVEAVTKDRKRITEPKKRALVSELRERLRYMDIENFADIVGGRSE